jgi:hypothetical protein
VNTCDKLFGCSLPCGTAVNPDCSVKIIKTFPDKISRLERRGTIKPSELMKVLQETIDFGLDDTTEILFDTEGKNYTYHMAKVERAYFEPTVLEKPFICLVEKR